MIFHIPHASTCIPEGLRSSYRISPERLDRDLLLMTDHFSDELFQTAMTDGDVSIVAQVSRLVVDVERFEDDSLELMSAVGMGVICERTQDGKLLRNRPSEAERAALINEYYQLHHDSLALAAEKALRQDDVATIIDCHSFPSAPLPYERNPSRNRPDVCIGVDDFHTPAMLPGVLAEFLRAEGYSVNINEPFSGCMVPLRYCQTNAAVHSIMIEVNRSLYMDETSGLPLSTGFDDTKTMIEGVVNLLRTHS